MTANLTSIGMIAIIMVIGISVAFLMIRARRNRGTPVDGQFEEPAQPDATAAAMPAKAELPVAAATTAAIAADMPEAPNSPPIATASPASDITQLKGLGPKLAATLAALGYARLEQIATLTPDQAAALDAQLGVFQGRMARDRWIEQARLLVAGDRAGYEAAFGKLG